MLQAGADVNACCIQGNGSWEDVIENRYGMINAPGLTQLSPADLIEHGEGVVIDLATRGQEAFTDSSMFTPQTPTSFFEHSSDYFESRPSSPVQEQGNFGPRRSSSPIKFNLHLDPNRVVFQNQPEDIPRRLHEPIGFLARVDSHNISELFRQKHCLTQIIRDLFNTEDEPNGADELLTLVESLEVSFSSTRIPK